MGYPPLNIDNLQINKDWDTAFYPGFLYVRPPRPPLVSSYVDWKNVVDYGADPTGTVDSATGIMLAYSNLSLGTITPPVAGQGGVLYFPAGNYKIGSTLQFNAIAPIYLLGDGPSATILNSYVNGDCISMYNNYVPTGGPASILVWGGGISDMTIDGTNAGGLQATGIHAGDLKYAEFRRLNLQNWSSAGSIAFYQDNRKFWTEDCVFEMHVNTSNFGIVIDTTGPGAQPTHDNNQYILNCGINNAGIGIRLIDGVNTYHSNFLIHGGIRSGVTAGGYFFEMLNTGGSTFATDCNLIIQGESDGGGANTPALVHIQSGCSFKGQGMLSFLTGHGTPSVINGTFQFHGSVVNDSGVTGNTPPTVSVLNTQTYTNNGIPFLWIVSGGTVTNILINGVATGQTSGMFYLPSGATYQVNGSVVPTTQTFIPYPVNQ